MLQDRTSNPMDSTPELPVRSDVVVRKGRPSITRHRMSKIVSRRFSMPPTLFDHSLLSIPPAVLAAQITLIDLPLFQTIPRKELTSCQWNSKMKQKVSPHIVAFIAHFNQICYWLVREILSVRDVKARSDRLAYIIHLADALFKLNNINSLKAVISTLSSQPIYRLTQTWELVSKKDHATYTQLSNLLSEDNNKAALRAYMETVPRPCIPFLGMYLTDLVFLDTARNEVDSSSPITSKERMEIMIDEICVLQMSRYDELGVNDVVKDYVLSQRYLVELQVFEEDQHYKMSLALEPATQPTRSSCDDIFLGMCSSPTKPQKIPESHSITGISSGKSIPPPPASLSRSFSFERNSPPHHRRSCSNCDSKELFSLSVIAPEATSGPRHLIDGSLMCCTVDSGSSETMAFSSSSGSAGDPNGHEGTNVVGVAVHCEDSDDGSETLLQNAFEDSDDHSDSLDSLRSNPECCWDCPTITGNVQIRKVASKGDIPESSHRRSSLRNTSGGGTGSSVFVLRPWKGAVARVCGNKLALFPLQKPSRRRDRTTSSYEPFHVVDLDKEVTVSCEKTRTVTIARPYEAVLHIKVATAEERQEWVSAILEAIESTRPKEPAPRDLLLDFNQPYCMPG